MTANVKTWRELFSEVIEAGLCTLCGACSGFCPYLTYYKGRIVAVENCARNGDAQCYGYCPRTYTDLDALSQTVFASRYDEAPIGFAKDVVIARSTDTAVRARSQYGGVVTTVLTFALERGLIDSVVMAKTLPDKTLHPFLAWSAQDVMQCAGSNYMACPVLEGYNQVAKNSGNRNKLAIVATPCQVLAITKMKHKPPQNRSDINDIKLVIGLFCTWALSPDRFHRFLRENLDLAEIVKFDIPPPPSNKFDVYTKSGVVSFPLEQIRQFTMPACAYCFDMTSEFADISVGAAEGIEGWNTVIIRTDPGNELWQLVLAEGKVEVNELPLQNLDHLKEAALLKKGRAIRELRKKSGNVNNLLYMGLPPGLADKLIA